ncbi:adenylate/guanylate cyclase domain-containing protein [Panacagrimonas perspica]|nr:adenylate/guanylate cyclase domain-containing protein [Panacagrimonas perspica]
MRGAMAPGDVVPANTDPRGLVDAANDGRPPDLRTRLVERFIAFNTWPASRKLALLTGPVLLAHLVGSTVAHFGFDASANIDLARLDTFLGWWSGAVAGFFALSLWLVYTARDWRAVPYAWVAVYSLFIVWMLHLFGTMSSPHMLWYPAVITLWAIYFDERVGVFSAAYLFVWIVLVGVLEVQGVIDYAPLLLDRTVDAQRNLGWLSAHVLVTVVLLSLSFLLQWLALSVRRVQETRLRQANALLDRSMRLIRRYVPTQIADDILAGGAQATGDNERRRLTIFFSDLVGFTEIAERLDPEDLSRIINEYFSEMTAIAERNGGTVDELSGDAILVLFGAPRFTNDRDHALRSVRTALQMQEAVRVLNARWAADGIDVAFCVRMGINSGVVTIGHFGSPDRMKYTALGTHVNVAARLQAICEPAQILISQATWLLVNDRMECASRGDVQLKGLQRPVTTYQVIGPH